MTSTITDTKAASHVSTISLSTDHNSVVALVRGENLSFESARTELALCSLDRFKREYVIALPTPANEYWWTARPHADTHTNTLADQSAPAIQSSAIPESIALAAGLIADNHAPEDWTCGVLTSEFSAFYLCLFSAQGIFGRISIQSPSLARLGIDLRQALITSLPPSISSVSAAGCDALYVSEDFPERDAAALAETLQILVERFPTDKDGLMQTGREFLDSEISRRCV